MGTGECIFKEDTKTQADQRFQILLTQIRIKDFDYFSDSIAFKKQTDIVIFFNLVYCIFLRPAFLTFALCSVPLAALPFF